LHLQTAHPTGNAGDGYLVDGDLYVWDAIGEEWDNVGNIQGPTGPQGNSVTGATGELVQQVLQVSLVILQLLQIHLQHLLMQVMLGLTLLMEKLMFIMIHTGLKQELLL
jgi:hypothetical protein